MFDIGFSEIFVIAVVALLVLGPERLPRAARFAGLWVRRARAQWYSVRSEFERELADEELRRSLLDARDDLREAGQRLHDSGASLKRDFESMDPDRRAADPVDSHADNLVDASDRRRRDDAAVEDAAVEDAAAPASDSGREEDGETGAAAPDTGDEHAPRA
ncbi:Sec-independent protein translocase protein TatB [Marilutibacter maris]|uniref:Sec-independent protein translocase protein TatB n=1 Tax=Marilutibacter maris TaxID=1605891 RepID=A0A2U9T0L1_9GAMM|nr:Sec-independent protein translocase protein TatB [Lysobacter maris]AWV05963.1 translocase [Lysobacter maris]